MQDKTFVRIHDAFRESQLSKLTGAQLKVLLCLALHCNQNMRCWPSYTIIAKETGFSRRHVITIMGELIARRLVFRQYRYYPGKWKRQGSNRYKVNVPFFRRDKKE